MTCLASLLGMAALALAPQDPGSAAVEESAPGGVEQAWAEAAALEPGPGRGRRVAELLATQDGPLEGPAQQLAYEAGKRAADALELDLALAIHRPLHASVGAVWSGFNLSLTLHRAGRTEAADAVLEALLEGASAADRANLWNQRGIFALGAGDAPAYLAAFGRSMALGSADATAILARERLSRHNLDPALGGFRAALNRNPDHPWALRGWGLALLSASQLRE
jgi:hypothetical protein